mgnify:CR=1 FL=1
MPTSRNCNSSSTAIAALLLTASWTHAAGAPDADAAALALGAAYKLYREGAPRIAFRPFKPDIYLVASIMTPAQRPLSNLAKAFARRLLDEIRPLAEASKVS